MKNDNGYDGRFSIMLEDNSGNKLAEESLDNLYSVREENKLHFNKDFEVHISDYNNDSINEISVGQDIEVSDKNVKVALGKESKDQKEKNIKSLQEYYLWNIEGNDLRRASGTGFTLQERVIIRQIPVSLKFLRIQQVL